MGDTVTVHVRLLGRSSKVVHGISFLLDSTRERLSNTFEFASVHVDLDARRTPSPWTASWSAGSTGSWRATALTPGPLRSAAT